MLATLLISPGLQTADTDLICVGDRNKSVKAEERQRHTGTKSYRYRDNIIQGGLVERDNQVDREGRKTRAKKSGNIYSWNTVVPLFILHTKQKVVFRQPIQFILTYSGLTQTIAQRRSRRGGGRRRKKRKCCKALS